MNHEVTITLPLARLELVAGLNDKSVYRSIDSTGQTFAKKLWKTPEDDPTIGKTVGDIHREVELEAAAYQYFALTDIGRYIPSFRGFIENADGYKIGMLVDWRDGRPRIETDPKDLPTPEEVRELRYELYRFAGKDRIPSWDMLGVNNICVIPWELYDGKGPRIWFAECQFEDYDVYRNVGEYLDIVDTELSGGNYIMV